MGGEIVKTNTAQLYDFISGDWTTLSVMMRDRSGHGCGMAKTAQGMVEAVMAGGAQEDTVEIYSFSTSTWR